MPRNQVVNRLVDGLNLHSHYIKIYILLFLSDLGSKAICQAKLVKWSDPVDTSLYTGARLTLIELGNRLDSFWFLFRFNYVRNEAAAFNMFLSLDEKIRDGIFYFFLFL